MRAADLAEATKAVARVNVIDDLAKRGLDAPPTQTVRVRAGAQGHYSSVNISRRLFAIIEREWRADLAAERAEHVRRLAQLGVTL